MAKKKYFAKTEEDFVGMEILSNKDSKYTILPWNGKRTENTKVKLYPIHCQVCEESPIFFDRTFYIRKGDALFGYTPCGCSGKFKMSEVELGRLASKLCEDSGKTFVKVFDYNSKHINKSLLSIYCPIHDTVYDKTSLNSLRTGAKGCLACGKEGIRESKFKTTEQFLDSFKLPDHVQVINDTVTEDNEGQKKYWYLFCDKCSYDKYVKAGICTGTFRTTRGQLQRGALPCRCNPTYPVTKERAKYDILKVCNERGYTFDDFVGQDKWYNRVKFSYTCSGGHNSLSDHHKMVTMGYGCSSCVKYGYYKETPDREDYLYLVLLWDRVDDVFSKVGRSFHGDVRYSEYKKANLIVSELLMLKGRHEDVFDLEQECHKFVSDEHYIPNTEFGGMVRECFGVEATDRALEFLRNSMDKYNLTLVRENGGLTTND